MFRSRLVVGGCLVLLTLQLVAGQKTIAKETVQLQESQVRYTAGSNGYGYSFDGAWREFQVLPLALLAPAPACLSGCLM